MKTKVLLLAVILLAIGSCTKYIDPITGEKMVAVDSNAVAVVEPYAETGIGALGALSGFIPVLAPFATLAIGIYGTWKKIKPKLTQAQTEATMYHSATESIVVAIEDFKKTYPDKWAELEAKLVKSIGPKTENIIRALRGLGPKE